MRINPHNRNEAYVTVAGLDEDVFIDGYIDRNRALEGDTVVVELVDKSQWKVRKTAKSDVDVEEDIAVVEEVVEELLDDEQLDNDERTVEDVIVTGMHSHITIILVVVVVLTNEYYYCHHCYLFIIF